MTIVNNLWEWPLRDFYDGVTTNRSGTLYENYQLYVDAGGQDTPALLELWREYLVSLGIMITISVEDARQYWIDNLSEGGGVPQFITINGQRGQLLLGRDGQYLTGADGAPLYGKAA